MKWIALVVLALLALSWLYENAADTFALLVNRFRHDGGDIGGRVPRSKTCTLADPVIPVGSTSNSAGSPSRVVDASNSPNYSVCPKCAAAAHMTNGGMWRCDDCRIQWMPERVPNVSTLSADEQYDIRKLAALVRSQRFTAVDPVLPPPSRSIRRTH